MTSTSATPIASGQVGPSPTEVHHHHTEKAVVQVDRQEPLTDDQLIRFHAIRCAVDAGTRFISIGLDDEEDRRPNLDTLLNAAHRIEDYIRDGAA